MRQDRFRWLAMGATGILAAGLSVAPAGALDVATFEKNLTRKVLPNGLTLLIYERPGAPVASFFTLVDAGAAQEVPGITGLAHMFEHMAFKGTTVIGTTDYKGEKKLLARVEEAYQAYDQERRKVGGPDPTRLKELETTWKDLQQQAESFVVANEFGEIIDRAGGVGLNAFTSSDQTGYFFSLPANKVELWAYLESERFLDPVFRQFYKERDVVIEERRMRTESSPMGRMIEQLTATAFTAHPYKQPVVGYMSDLQSFSMTDAIAFQEKYYVPSNIKIAIVGDVKAKEILPILEKYFGRIPASPAPPPLRTVEPQQIAEKTFVQLDKAQPVYVEAYHRPAATDPDDPVYTAISEILSSGRVSRLYRSLVRDKKVAAQARVMSGFPGEKYPSLLLFFAIPTPGTANETVQAALREEIEKIKSTPVSDDEMQRFKTRAKADLIRGLQSNQGIASQLASYETLYGDWRELFRSVDKIDKVTKEDIMRVASAVFVPQNRTVGMIVNEGAPRAKN